MTNRYEKVCFLCGSVDLSVRKYLKLDSDSLARNVAYALPEVIGRLLSRASRRFASAYAPVLTNKRYFDRSACYCSNCRTGEVFPRFSDEELSCYYRDFYWSNRDTIDGNHVPLDDRPNDKQLILTGDRIDWIRARLPSLDSVIDFGAGDCAAAFVFRRSGLSVHVVDPSDRARDLAVRYHSSHSVDLELAPVVDLLYSAHSIEHVSDLMSTITKMLAHVPEGGHIFMETPNIGDVDVFHALVHTPHTWMLSCSTFEKLAESLPLRIVAMESCGPMWRDGHRLVRSSERTDLRVLLQKTVRPLRGESK